MGHLSCYVFAIRYPDSASSTGSRSQHVATRHENWWPNTENLKTHQVSRNFRNSGFKISKSMDAKLMQERTGSLNILNVCVVGPLILLASALHSDTVISYFKLQKDRLIHIIIIKDLQEDPQSSMSNSQQPFTLIPPVIYPAAAWPSWQRRQHRKSGVCHPEDSR